MLTAICRCAFAGRYTSRAIGSARYSSSLKKSDSRSARSPKKAGGVLEAKQYLQALTPFTIVGGGSAAPGPDLVGQTPEYLADRAIEAKPFAGDSHC